MHYQLRRYTNQCPMHSIVFGVGATHTKRRGHMNEFIIISGISAIFLFYIGFRIGRYIVLIDIDNCIRESNDPTKALSNILKYLRINL